MWITSVYSQGDLLNDEYLQVNRHYERDIETGEVFETYEDKFNDYEALQERIEFITSCIERLQKEKETLLTESELNPETKLGMLPKASICFRKNFSTSSAA